MIADCCLAGLHNKACICRPCQHNRTVHAFGPPMFDAQAQRKRWQATQRITVTLLAVWLGVTFGVTYFARELNGHMFGWPFSFWVAAQGALIVYLVLVCLYARSMRRLDEAFGTSEQD